MNAIDIFQSVAAMADPTDLFGTIAKDIQAKVDKVSAAGYQGMDIPGFLGPDVLVPWADTLYKSSMDMTISYMPSLLSLEDLFVQLRPYRSKVRFVNSMAKIEGISVSDAAKEVRSWLAIGKTEDMPVYLETHRGTLSQDPLFTLQLLKEVPELELVADLSHPHVVGEWGVFGPNPRDEEIVTQLLSRAASIQGRISSGEQIQIPSDWPQHKPWADLYKSWWRRGFSAWKQRHQDQPDARFVWLNELLPPPYAMTGLNGLEVSDRWQEGLNIKAWVQTAWQEN